MRGLPSIREDILDLDTTRGQRRQLLDMADHLGQHLPQTVQGQDGALYLAWGGISTDLPDVEPYPRLSPQGRTDAMGATSLDAFAARRMDAGNTASAKALEAEFEAYGLQELIDDDGQHMVARANPIGPRAVHRWQVVWLGSRKEWLVTEGSLHWREGTVADSFTSTRARSVDFSRTFLAGQQGWITLPCQILPEGFTFDDSLGNFTGGYRLAPPVRPSLSQTPPSQSPPIKTILFSGVLQDAESPLLESHSFTAGTLHIPIAWVSPPNRVHRTPQIIPFATNDIELSSELWLGSLPLLSML